MSICSGKFQNYQFNQQCPIWAVFLLNEFIKVPVVILDYANKRIIRLSADDELSIMPVESEAGMTLSQVDAFRHSISETPAIRLFRFSQTESADSVYKAL